MIIFEVSHFLLSRIYMVSCFAGTLGDSSWHWKSNSASSSDYCLTVPSPPCLVYNLLLPQSLIFCTYFMSVSLSSAQCPFLKHKHILKVFLTAYQALSNTADRSVLPPRLSFYGCHLLGSIDVLWYWHSLHSHIARVCNAISDS